MQNKIAYEARQNLLNNMLQKEGDVSEADTPHIIDFIYEEHFLITQSFTEHHRGTQRS